MFAQHRSHVSAALAFGLLIAMLPVATHAQTVAPTRSAVPGIWINKSELAALSTSSTTWSKVKAAADTNLLGGVITTRDNHNVRVLAAALVAARLNSNTYRARVRDALVSLMKGPVDTNDGLALLRRLGTYAVAADLIELKTFAPTVDTQFRAWLQKMRTVKFSGGGGGGTLITYHERRPNNFGTHAGFSRAAVALYLGDKTDLQRSAVVFKGWLGDRAAYTGFSYGSLWWHCDPSRPMGINPPTCQMSNLNGALPDDQRRAGGYTWPPPKENYVWEALQGAFAQAVVLHRAGYDPFAWQSKALLRAVQWLHVQAKYPAEGDDTWVPHIANKYYGTSFPAPKPARPGKNAGYTDWTHTR